MIQSVDTPGRNWPRYFKKDTSISLRIGNNSIFLQLMFTRHASKVFKAEKLPVNIYAVNPGLVGTDMFYNTPAFKPISWMGKILKTPEQGAVSVLHCCVSDIEDKSGVYISNCVEGISNSFSKNVSYQECLFDLTCKMLKIEKFGH